MAKFTKHLTIVALIAAVGAAGTAIAQTAYTDDPQDTPQTAADAQHGNTILRFKDEGASPETDPSAHLLLIKDVRPMQTAAVEQTTTQTTTVAQAAPQPVAAPMDTTTTDNSSSTAMAPDTSADVAPIATPRADRN